MRLQNVMLGVMTLSCGLVVNAQVKNFSGDQCYGDIAGYVCGTEKYTYQIDDYGDKIINGAYSFTGSKKMSDNTTEFTASYKLNSQIKDGHLNGTYSQSATYSGKKWSWTRGWEPFHASSSFTGVFKQGKPDGTLSYVYKNERDFTGSATLKNGKFVGNYNYSGYGDRSAIMHISGQLTQDGKLTGKWKYTDLGISNLTFVFQNDVLISREGSENDDTTPFLQEMAKKYAAGTITEKELNAQNVYLTTKKMPLTDIIEYVFLMDEFGLPKHPGKYSFEDYEDIQYTELVRLNAFTNEGFKAWIEYVKQGGTAQNIHIGDDYYNIIWLVPTKDEQYGLQYIMCDAEFAKEYTQLHNQHRVYFSAEQMKEYERAREEAYISIALPFSAYIEASESVLEIYNLLDTDRGQAEVFVLDKKQEERDNLKWRCNQLQDQLLKRIVEYTQDSMYIVVNTDHYDSSKKVVLKNDMQKLDTIMSIIEGANYEYGKYLEIKEQVESNNTKILGLCQSDDIIYQEYKSFADTINTDWNGAKTNSYLSSISDKQSAYETAITDYAQNVKTIQANHTQLMEMCKPNKLILAEYSAYAQTIDMSWTGLSTTEKLQEVVNKQEQYLNTIQGFNENTKRINANNEQIITEGKAYKNISKAYKAYMKSVNLSWVGLDTNVKLEKVLDIQGMFAKAISATNAVDIDKRIKDSKDKSTDAILKIIE